MRRLVPIIFIIFSILVLFYFYFVDKPFANKTERKLVVYSDLNSALLSEWVETFNKNNELGINILYVKELDGSKIQADVIITDVYNLNLLARGGSLEALEYNYYENKLSQFKDESSHWIGLFYDPMVFFINHRYARKHGQDNILSWNDLLNRKPVRLVLENFDNSNFQQNILASIASNYGEDNTLLYFSKLHNSVVQYTKYSFSPLRMVVSRDADIALTSLNYICQTLGNEYSAYIVIPDEGTPTILYGAGIYKGSDSKDDAFQFIKWLYENEEVQNIAIKKHSGWQFLNSFSGRNLCKLDKLWLNSKYTDQITLDALVDKWYTKVRFGFVGEN